jgi:site-specific DNA recombinase
MNEGQALIYCRVSTRKQEDEGTSLGTQEEACIKHAKALGYTIGHVTRETFSGAELWERPLLNEDRATLRGRQYAALISYATDRLSRNPIHLAIIAEECARVGVELIFVSEPLENTKEGALIRYVKGYAADMEREKIRDRNMRGKHAHVRAGNVQTWGFPPFGYRIERIHDAANPHTRPRAVRIIHEEEAAIVRRIYRMVGDDGLSLSSVVRQLNAEGVPSPGTGRYERRGPDWSPRWGLSQVSRLIRRPDYKGECFALTTELGAAGKRVPRERADWVSLPESATPALVDLELWERAQKVAATKRTHKAPDAQHPYLLRGRIFCSVCGLPLRSTPDHGRFIYRCSSRETPAGKCSGKPVPAGDALPKTGLPRDESGRLLPITAEMREHLELIPGVDTAVWQHVAMTLQNPELIEAEVERQRTIGPDPTLQGDLAAAKRMHAEKTSKQRRLLEQFSASSDDNFPWDLVKGEIGRLEKEKTAVGATVDDLEERISHQTAATARLEELTRYCERVAHNLDTLNFEERRLAVEALGVTVRATGRDATIHYAIPSLNGEAVSGKGDQLFRSWVSPTRQCRKRASGCALPSRTPAENSRRTGSRSISLRPT